MPRRYEISIAFRAAIKHEHGRRTVSTVDFQAELAKLNHHFTLREANRWIEFYQTSFTDISTEEGERRIFSLFSPSAGY
ncbi:hypothetical protein [Erwinia sp. Leaf53]|uniref:hypothetical protein n=1 Tax=Erwinia sp. Leaf53 TaxID=1736225 RepID=UPI00070236D3|nr:hypothetical protein [Erwinia sp. Leaf53]KQN56713.1 DNA polymerase V [Erwinia sp. Leaf53]